MSRRMSYRRLRALGSSSDPIAYVIAEKQLYSSHYFETALDSGLCVRDTGEPKQPGFCLIMVMGS